MVLQAEPCEETADDPTSKLKYPNQIPQHRTDGISDRTADLPLSTDAIENMTENSGFQSA
jgi:hypothetical protein